MRTLPDKFMEAKETLTLVRDNEYFLSPQYPSLYGETESIMFINLVTIYLTETTLRFALCDIDILFNGNVYSAFPVNIGVIKNSVDGKRDNVDITIADVTDAFKVYLFSGGDFRDRTLEIGRVIYPDSIDDPSLYDMVFSGQMDEPSLDDGKSEFSVSVKDPMSNYTCGRTLMLSCNAVFGDAEDCGATKEFIEGIVQPLSTATHINIQGTYPDNHWKYGIITIGTQSVTIIESSDTQIITEYPFYLPPMGNYALQSGCSKLFQWCGDRYGNQRNFSGCPGIPWENTVRT